MLSYQEHALPDPAAQDIGAVGTNGTAGVAVDAAQLQVSASGSYDPPTLAQFPGESAELHPTCPIPRPICRV